MGFNALKNFTGDYTSAFGYEALRDLSSGTVCSAFGSGAAKSATTADAISAFGYNSLTKCNAPQNNSFGYNSDVELTTGVANCTFGSLSGCNDASYNIASANTCIGYNVKTSGGSYNTYLGYFANSSSPIATNFSTAIGANSTPTANNQVMLGTATEYVQVPNYMDVVNYITTATQTAGTNNTRVATTAFVQTAVSAGGASLLSSANAWTNTNTFNSFLPTSTLAPTTGNDLVNKTYADTKGGLTLANAWTNTNTFNSFLPTSTLAPTTGNDLVNRTYADTKGGLASANAWTGNTNTFNSFLPTSTIAATTANQLTNKTYVDGAITTAISNIKQTSTTTQYWTDEFLNGLAGNGITPLFPWTATTTGSVAMTAASLASIAGHMGIWRISSTGAAAANRGYILRQTTAGWFMSDVKGFEYVFNVSITGVKCTYSVNCGLTNAAFTQIVALRYIRDGATGLNPNNEVEIGFNGVYTYLTGSNIWGGGLSNWVSFAITNIDTAGNLTIVLKNFTGGTSFTTTYAGGTGFLANTGQQGIFQFSDTTVSPTITYTCDLDYFSLAVQQSRA